MPGAGGGPALATRAPAKINLTLHVLGRRPDGYHELESLVAFAGAGDALGLTPAPETGLSLHGPMAEALAADPDNLVLRATRALAASLPGLRGGRFALVKRLPVASGIGGGSADAAAALRLLGRLNGLAPEAPELLAAARQTGADVPVCLASRARMMAGIGERLGPVLALPKLFAVLVNPGMPVATVEVFGALGLAVGMAPSVAPPLPVLPHEGGGIHGSSAANADDGSALARLPPPLWGRVREGGMEGAGEGETAPIFPDAASLTAWLAAQRNDLEAPARRIAPAIGTVLEELAASRACRLARMSGSGATCFGLYDDCRASTAAARAIAARHPGWWIKATVLR